MLVKVGQGKDVGGLSSVQKMLPKRHRRKPTRDAFSLSTESEEEEEEIEEGEQQSVSQPVPLDHSRRGEVVKGSSSQPIRKVAR